MAAVVGVTLIATGVWLAVGTNHRSDTTVTAPTPAEIARAQPRSAEERVVSEPVRHDALTRARVWPEPSPPVADDQFRAATIDEIACRFVVTRLGGTTPKFDCALASGETIRVKYGSGSEIPSEAAATRLVRALGFAADTITLVKRLRCHGCPIEPFTTLKTAAAVHAGELYSKAIDYAEHRRLRVGGRRAQVRRRADRNRDPAGLVLPRARSGQCVEGRRRRGRTWTPCA